MKTIKAMSRWSGLILFGALAAAASAVSGQTPLAWEQAKYFRYNIENVTVTQPTGGPLTVKVIFSVSNPEQDRFQWDIKDSEPFKNGSLTLDIAWNPKTDFTNKGSTGALAPLNFPLPSSQSAPGAAMPVQVRNLQTTGSRACGSPDDCPGVSYVGRKVYFVSKDITPIPGADAGRVALEGRPVCKNDPSFPLNCPPPGTSVSLTGAIITTYANIPVKSATADFAIPAPSATTAVMANQRRQIVDIKKCQGCHDDQKHGDVVVPRLSLHGANRNENLELCVTCHNPNQTDVPYRYLSTSDARIGGPETPIDFKVMVHSIHAGGFRKTPYVVIGRGSSVNDFSGVRFPAELRKSCLKCHIEANGKGSFELPLNSNVLGTTIKTQSVYQVAAGAPRSIDVNPDNDTKITPTAATCSACHDNSEVRSHMIRTGGASFATTQDKIGTTVKERCATCHGPGKEKDVRKVHELSSSSN